MREMGAILGALVAVTWVHWYVGIINIGFSLWSVYYQIKWLPGLLIEMSGRMGARAGSMEVYLACMSVYLLSLASTFCFG